MLNKMTRLTFLGLSASVALSLSGCGSTPTLEQADIIQADVLARKQVAVLPTTIEFASTWIREHRRGSSQSDIDSLQQRYSDVMTRSLTTHLEQQGFTITTSPTAMTTQLSITNMRITAPDFKGSLSDLYTHDEHGSGNFELTFTQGDTTVAQFKDQRDVKQGSPGQMNRTNRGLNQRAFDRALGRFVSDALNGQ